MSLSPQTKHHIRSNLEILEKHLNRTRGMAKQLTIPGGHLPDATPGFVKREVEQLEEVLQERVEQLRKVIMDERIKTRSAAEVEQ